MTTQGISARNLLRETFAAMGTLYAPLLIIYSPSLIFFVAFNSLGGLQKSTGVALYTIYSFVVIPFLSGAMIFYTYRSLARNQVTVGQAFNQASRRFLHLILVNILFALLVSAGFIALIIPGIYVSCRLIFSPFATVIDNSSALDSISSSWNLTKGHWWLVCRAISLITFVVFVPTILISGLIGSILGNLLASQLLGQVLGLIAAVLINVYLVLLYKALRKSAGTI
ncbi:hypothetical protein [Microcoleus sp. B4-D4]|uniref:hypothetical protein n=1 Tax=Microcoleus sp. B4-D4 TaxID=2818667 RepID=UPI002FD2BFB0